MEFLELLKSVAEKYLGPVNEAVDRFPIMNNPLLVLGIAVIYLVFATKLGPKWMAKREPFKLRGLLLLYNLLQVIFCSILLLVVREFVFSYELNFPTYTGLN